MLIELDPLRVLLLSVCVFWLGGYLNKKISFLENYSIPAPVTGGLICSIAVAMVNVMAGIEIVFDLQMRDSLLLIFVPVLTPIFVLLFFVVF